MPLRRLSSPVVPLSAALGALACALAAGSPARAAPDPGPEPPRAALTPGIDGDQFLTRDSHLASEGLQGRESGTPGGTAAEDYVAAEFARFGLEPAGEEKTAFQSVPLPWRPLLVEGCSLEVRAVGEEKLLLTPFDGAVPFGGTRPCDLAAGVVFAGYGLSASADGYDDWQGLDAKGNVAIVLRHGPREEDTASPWFLRKMDKSRMDSMSFEAKTKRAAEAGAVAVLFVNDRHHKDQGLPTTGGPALALPAFAIGRDTANRILRGLGKELVHFEEGIDGDLKPRSAAVPRVTVALRASLGDGTARNVLAVLRGTDPKLRGEAVVVSAHTDHVGLGWFGSAGGARGEIHNGADDNASGTAALLEVAESLAAGPPMKRSVVFAGWCGEEKGLIGSERWCNKPTWPLADVVANVNLDMIGRYRDTSDDDSGLLVVGIPTGTGFTEKVEAATKPQGLRVTPSWEAWEQSDHFSLYRRKIPVLFLHTGLHPDYHRAGDDWWKLEAKGAAKIAAATADLVRRLADDPGRPEFREKPKRAILGVNLGDEADGKGARVGQVVPGLAAANAGVQQGDVIVEADGKPVRNSADLMKILADRKPGDEVPLVYRRAGAEAKVTVKLSAR